MKKPELDWFNPYPRLIKKHQAMKSLDLEVVDVFRELAKEGKIPRFVFNEFSDDLDLIQAIID